jgi:hypothetical protein
MDVKISDQIERVSNNKSYGDTMKIGTIVTVKKIVSKGKVSICEQNGIWHLVHFKKLNKVYELWI